MNGYEENYHWAIGYQYNHRKNEETVRAVILRTPIYYGTSYSATAKQYIYAD